MRQNSRTCRGYNRALRRPVWREACSRCKLRPMHRRFARSFRLASFIAFLAMIVFTSTPSLGLGVEISRFNGADPGEGLDLVGDFAYAVNISGFDRGVIGDAQFLTESIDGVTIESGFRSTLPFLFEPEYGDTGADETLERFMSTFRGSKTDGLPEHVTFELHVDPGQSYKMQMMFAEYCCDRGFNIFVEDELLVSDFAILDHHLVPLADIRNRTDGVVVTHTLTAIDDRLTVELRNGISPEREMGHGIIHAVTLEKISGLHAGDADQDFDFDQLDLVQVLSAGKYLTRQVATWGEGDWNGAFGGEGDPPRGDGRFDQLDILLAVAEGTYLSGPHAAVFPVSETLVAVSSSPAVETEFHPENGWSVTGSTAITSESLDGRISIERSMLESSVDGTKSIHVPEPRTFILLVIFIVGTTRAPRFWWSAPDERSA